jgi:hypothetical protein
MRCPISFQCSWVVYTRFYSHKINIIFDVIAFTYSFEFAVIIFSNNSMKDDKLMHFI